METAVTCGFIMRGLAFLYPTVRAAATLENPAPDARKTGTPS